MANYFKTGGCLCKEIRYSLAGKPAKEGAGYCHCRKCQLSSGSPIMAWVTFPKNKIITTGNPKKFHSSTKAIRSFCSSCGTSLFFEYTEGPDDVDISIASLDNPELIIPTYHIWTSSQIPWIKIDDSYPRFEDDGPDFSPYKPNTSNLE